MPGPNSATSSRASSARGSRRKTRTGGSPALYDFAGDLGATVVRTAISRSIIDVNRDPSGASLYPGQATTELCPTTTFDGEALYRDGEAPDADEIAERAARYFDPYHAALRDRDRAAAREASRASCSMTPIRSARSFRACSRASCRSSTSERIPARAARRPCATARRALAASGELHRRRPLQGRLDHPPLWRARHGVAGGADGAGLPRLYASNRRRPGRTPGRRPSIPLAPPTRARAALWRRILMACMRASRLRAETARSLP